RDGQLITLIPTGNHSSPPMHRRTTESDFPFHLIKSDPIPPAPTRPESGIDWLPDYLGHTWVAYAASSLLVISNFPSPSKSNDQTVVDPFYRQVIELSSDVSAVCWSPLCCGDVAAALDNCVAVFSHCSEARLQYLCKPRRLRPSNGQVQEMELSWEIAWKFKPEFPQSLVSTTSVIDGPFATAPLNKDSTSVLICHGKSKCIKAELHHHVPVSMIQWRPLVANQWKETPKHPLKLVLLTCCADGTVRLWSEIDDGRARKTGKAHNDQRPTASSFRVAATIEINQAVNGILGSNCHEFTVELWLQALWKFKTMEKYRSRVGTSRHSCCTCGADHESNWKRAQSTLQHLLEHLSSNNADLKRIPQMSLPDYVEGLFPEKSNNKAFTWDSNVNLDQFSYSSWESNGSTNPTSTRSGLSGLTKSLEKLQDISAITNSEKMQILAVVDLLDEISNSNTSSPYGGLDESGRSEVSAVVLCKESREMERLAKQQYLKNKDPKACTLLYIALNRLQVLAGLYKISKDEKDKPLVAFLSRNFQDEKNKAAALKNAYVLMGRHQLELAVAFFLLGGDTASAINVCTKTLGDEQLALVICRLIEGYNGPSEHHLISKFLLPSAYENGDYWKSSILEWVLGNYSRAFMSMLGEQVTSPSNKSALLSNHSAFKDPSVGQYCLMLANKNQMKNAIGEQNTATLCRWAVLMNSTALSRCGLPIEALECLSSSVSIFSGSEQKSRSDNSETKILNERLNPSALSSNWISGDVALHVLSHAKYSFAMQYVANLLTEHPSWQQNFTPSSDILYNTLLSTFENKLNAGLAYFEQKYSLTRYHLINMIIVSLYNHGLMFIGCHMLQHERFALNGNPSYPTLPMLILKVSFDSNMKILKDFLPKLFELLDPNEMTVQTIGSTVSDQNGHDIPEKDKWQIIRASLCGLMSGFLKHQIDLLPENLEGNYSFRPPCKLSSYMSNDSTKGQLQLSTVVLTKLLKVESEHALSYCAKQLASFLLQKVKDQSNESTILWLENLCRSTPITNYRGLVQGVDFDFSSILNNEEGLSTFEVLWSMFDNQKILCGDFAVEYSKWSQLIKQKHSKGWSDVYTSIIGDHEPSVNDNQEAVDHSVDLSVDHYGYKDSDIKMKHIPFQKPKEVHKINGELLEALCINSIDQQQAAIACNKKGIVFYNWEDGRSSFDKSNYIWTDVDWPTDGWAGSESTPVPTCVSPGIGLGSRKGTHLGLGGATIGMGLAKPVSTSNLGWEIQQDFEELVDPPATFGKNTATATYGVLPAANVPPPYALASISAVHFDHCGQRFATAASDGTVCTWQLEVGGRSNVRPTESDVTYVTSSGSIVAAAGYSSNNVNVVIWDTLAPPTTSRASIMCHEGGARSICVFADEIGSGSVSPLIVTGGKGGDVGVHDFRYIATRRPKKHKNSDNNEQKFSASSTAGLHNKHGDQNRNGMLWYIPKAHSGIYTDVEEDDHQLDQELSKTCGLLRMEDRFCVFVLESVLDNPA
ncbi:hypothetical protein M8C21_003249, partial [Ambrosia artemisiifolia]